MKNKIKFALVLPLFLASCSSKTNSKPIVSPNQSQTNNSTEKPNTDTKPSISNTNSTPQEIDVEEKFTSFLFNIKKGYVFKGTNFYYTDDGYSNYCLDVKVKKEGYEFIRYDSKQNEKADRSSVYISYFYSYDPNAKVPYVSEPLLDISNTIDYTPAPIGDNGEIVKWKDSSYVNLLDSLTIDDFEKIDETTFRLSKKKYDYEEIISKLAEQFYPKNPGRTISAFSFVYDKNTDSFSFEMNFAPYGGLSRIEMNITGTVEPGNGFEFEKEVKVSQEKAKDELEEAFNHLKKHHYSFEDTIYKPNEDETSLVLESKNSGKTDQKSLILKTETEDTSVDFLYLSKNDSTIQQAINLEGDYYNYHGPVKANITSLLPTFNISSAFFDKKEESTYVYNKKAMFSKTQIYNLSGEGMIVSEMTIRLVEGGVKFNINFSYPQRTEEILYTFEDDLSIEQNIVTKETTDGIKLSTLLSGYKKNLAAVEELVGGKDNLDLIPVLGNTESVAGLYYSDGVDSEGNEKGERYYGVEYRLLPSTGSKQILEFERKLESKGFTYNKDKTGTHFGGDIYQKSIQKNNEDYTLELEVGYSSDTLAFTIDAYKTNNA